MDEPPVIVRPLLEESPAVESPPAKVEVAVVEVATTMPNCPLPPSTEEPCTVTEEERPPVKVLVAVEVEVTTPVVMEPEVRAEKTEEAERRMLAKKLVEVALVKVVPPFESMTKAVVVAPAVGSAKTERSGRLLSEEVAEIVKREAGEVVPMPTTEAKVEARVVEVATKLPAVKGL